MAEHHHLRLVPQRGDLVRVPADRPLEAAMDRLVEDGKALAFVSAREAVADLVWLMHTVDHEYMEDRVMVEQLSRFLGREFEPPEAA